MTDFNDVFNDTIGNDVFNDDADGAHVLRADSFDDMHLREELLRGVYAYGFETPSEVQQLTIVPMHGCGGDLEEQEGGGDGGSSSDESGEGRDDSGGGVRPRSHRSPRPRDMLVQAQAGTGKTASYAIACLQRLDLNPDVTASAEGQDAEDALLSPSRPQVLVLVPTRELAMGVAAVFWHLAEYMLPDNTVRRVIRAIVGGTRVRDDIEALTERRASEERVKVVVGTPGRVADLMQRGAFNTAGIKCLVMDEVDELLSRGFGELIDDVFRMVTRIDGDDDDIDAAAAVVAAADEDAVTICADNATNGHRNVQCALFSATMPADVMALAGRVTRDPLRVRVRRAELTLESVRQFYVGDILNEEQKVEVLADILEDAGEASCVVYLSTRRKTDYVAGRLLQHGMEVSSFHGDLAAAERTRLVDDFRSGNTRVLLTTDLPGRSALDPSDKAFVIQYDLPRNRENYIHRIGRGRFGKGLSICLVTTAYWETSTLRDIQDFYSAQFDELPENFQDFIPRSEIHAPPMVKSALKVKKAD